jgi:hypothetical protein
MIAHARLTFSHLLGGPRRGCCRLCCISTTIASPFSRIHRKPCNTWKHLVLTSLCIGVAAIASSSTIAFAGSNCTKHAQAIWKWAVSPSSYNIKDELSGSTNTPSDVSKKKYSSSYTVSHTFTPPVGYCQQLDPFPAAVDVSIKRKSFIEIIIKQTEPPTEIVGGALVESSGLSVSRSVSYNSTLSTVEDFNSPLILSRSDGSYPFDVANTVRYTTSPDNNYLSKDNVFVMSALDVSFSIQNPNVPIRYLLPAPAPFTSMGAIVAFRLAVRLRRRTRELTRSS